MMRRCQRSMSRWMMDHMTREQSFPAAGSGGAGTGTGAADGIGAEG
jgi:hypothetical protein